MASDVLTGTLSNGMRWIAAHDAGAKSVSFSMLTLAGSRCEPQGKRGLAHLVEHLQFTATQHYTTSELTEQIYDYGGSLNAYTTNDMAVYHCKITPANAERLFAFFSEILFYPLYREEDIEKEKGVVLQEISTRSSNPVAMLAMVLIPQHAWAGTPAETPVGGNEADIRSITRADVLRFVAQYYQPANIVLSIAGQLDGLDIEALFTQYFNYTTHVERAPAIPIALGIIQDKAKQYEIEAGGDDATIAIVFPYDTLKLSKPALALLSAHLFDTMTSRLFLKLRTEMGLIYSVSALSSTLRDVSLFGFVFATKKEKDNVSRVIEASLAELNEIATNGLNERALARAKRYVVESARLELEDSMTLAAFYGEQLLLTGEVRMYDAERIDAVLALTNVEVQYTAAELFTLSRLNLAVVV